MARIRHLRNAPITEAVVDFRVALPPDFRPEQLRSAEERLASRYPKVVERKGMETLVELAGDKLGETRTRELGFQGLWLKTEDQKTIGQFRVDGFTFNRLKPYTRWEEILPEALRLWEVYVEVARPEAVTRVAVRYINHLKLPSADVDLDEYIVTTPRLPQSVPGILAGFSTRVVLQHPERPLTANVTQVLERGVETPARTLLFDIDVYRAGHFDTRATSLQEILADLRVYKNEIFFGSLTEQFVGVYE